MTLVTSADIQTLNDARRVLWDFSQSAMRDLPETTNVARARAFADVAENAVFDFLNVLNAYYLVQLSHAQLHTDSRPESAAAFVS